MFFHVTLACVHAAEIWIDDSVDDDELIIFSLLPLYFTSQLTEENAQKQQQTDNESWFWEHESSSTSSKRDDRLAAPEDVDVDLTTISLDANDQDTAEKLRQQIVEREKALKLITAENAELNEKLKHSFKQNQELERSIEELDQQHQLAIEKVLDVKKNVQKKLTKVLEENESLKTGNSQQLEKLSHGKIDVENQLEQLTEITKNYEQQIEELNDSNLKLETDIAELRKTSEKPAKNDDCLKKINLLVNTNFSIDEPFTDEPTFMENISRFLTKISFELSALADENKLIKDEIGKYANERDKLKSELINYELECSELVKNNSILMADIETLRGRKLETIMENEDEENNTVVGDDSNQDEFNSIRSKLDETEAERSEYYEEVQQLKREIAQQVTKCKLFQEEIENLENEKSNYLFELNELKTEEERNILQKEVKAYKEREIELTARLETIEAENGDLKEQLSQLETSLASRETDASVEAQNERKKIEKIRDEASLLEKTIEELKIELKSVKDELATLRTENESLVLKSEEMRKIHDSNLDDLKKTCEIVQELQQKLLAAQTNDELASQLQNELDKLKSQNDILTSEAQNSSKTQQELVEKLENLQLSQTQSSELQEKLENLEIELAKIHAENAKLTEENQQSKKITDEIAEKLQKSEQTIEEFTASTASTQHSAEADARISQLEESADRLTKEKEELIALLTTKHNENVQYHNEIIRLTQLLQQESQKIKSVTEENTQVREKLESFAESVLQEQNTNRLLVQEKNDLLEQNNILNKDIERLRQHLLEVADAYTFEQVSLQKQVEEYKCKYMEIESEVKKSATAFTSANIRANQQAETLQTQYTLLLQQRDDLLAKLSAAEDKDNKNQAALTNLQVALEIFQNGEHFSLEFWATWNRYTNNLWLFPSNTKQIRNVILTCEQHHFSVKFMPITSNMRSWRTKFNSSTCSFRKLKMAWWQPADSAISWN